MHAPFFKRKEVFHGYLALFGPIKEMLAKLKVGDPSISPSASVAESHSRELLAEPLRFRWIVGPLETVGELKERSSPLLVSHDRIRQKIDDSAISADMTARGDSVDFFGQVCRKRNASPDEGLYCEDRSHISPEYTTLHQAANYLHAGPPCYARPVQPYPWASAVLILPRLIASTNAA
jgi:hypothetical protein